MFLVFIKDKAFDQHLDYNLITIIKIEKYIIKKSVVVIAK